jgi:hypothetical protein
LEEGKLTLELSIEEAGGRSSLSWLEWLKWNGIKHMEATFDEVLSIPFQPLQ